MLAQLGPVPADLPAALAARGLPVTGALADPFLDLPGERYAGVLQVLAAAEAGRVRAAVVGPPAAPLLPDLVAAGLPVLLAEAGPWDPDLLTEVRRLATDRGPAQEDAWLDDPGTGTSVRLDRGPDEVPVGVLLRLRAAGWAVAADAALRDADAPTQVVVRGWGAAPEVEAGLVDLLLRWCGDVVAVCAAPHALPAAALPDGEPVAWALLAESGATVLLAPGGADPQVRLSFPARRLVAGPGGVAWSDGTGVAPVRPGLPVLGADEADEPPWTPAEQLAAALRVVLRTGLPDALGTGPSWPWPADLGDLLPVSRVLAARDRSAREQRWVELA